MCDRKRILAVAVTAAVARTFVAKQYITHTHDAKYTRIRYQLANAITVSC